MTSTVPAGRGLGRGGTAALLALTMLGLGLRLWNVDFGLPGVFNPDERPILDRALAFAKGDLNPRNFLYPTLYFYVLFAWEGCYFAAGRVLGWFGSVADFQNAFFVDPSGHVLAARVLTALCGAATIPATYAFGRRLYGPAVGLASAAFLAVAPLAVRDAHYVKHDVPVALLVALCHAALASIAVDPAAASKRTSWIAVGFLAGIAVSTHYYAVFLGVPLLVLAVADVQRSGSWRTTSGMASAAALAALAGFVAGSPYFFVTISAVVRDSIDQREVLIDRAVGAGLFSSLGTYARLLGMHAVGVPIAVLAGVGVIAGLANDWRRGALLVAFPVAFLAFIANTYPASRYLNALVPCVAVAAACGAAELARRVRPSSGVVMAALSALAASPALADSIRWDRFLGQDDTRTLAARYVERSVPAGATILVQPYGAPLRQSREGLVEALRARLGSEAAAPLKYRLQLAASPYPSPSYRLMWVGASGRTGAVPGDVDKIYLPPRAFDTSGRRVLVDNRIDYVVLTRYGPTPAPLLPLESTLRSSGRRVALFSPYREGINAAVASLPPFRHNDNTWIDGSLARPGPIVEVWSVEPR